MTVVSCKENIVCHAAEGETIDFGFVDSCMTITVTLRNRTRVGAHFVQDSDRDQLISRMRQLIGSVGVESIIAHGSLSTWTPDLKPQTEMVNRRIQSLPLDERQAFEADIYERQEEVVPFSIRGDKEQFKRWLRWKLHTGIVDVTVQDHISGSIEH